MYQCGVLGLKFYFIISVLLLSLAIQGSFQAVFGYGTEWISSFRFFNYIVWITDDVAGISESWVNGVTVEMMTLAWAILSGYISIMSHCYGF